MAIITPNFGIEVPTPLTKLKKLGAELEAFGLSVDSILADFDYNGADPNLVLSRVTALETWRTATDARLAAVEASIVATTRDTGWLSFRTVGGFNSTWGDPSNGAIAQIRRVGSRIRFRGSFNNNTAYTTPTSVGILPVGFRPQTINGQGSVYAFVLAGASTVTKQIRVDVESGQIAVYASAGITSWYLDMVTWETEDSWPVGY